MEQKTLKGHRVLFGQIAEIGDVEAVGENGTLKQEFILFVPGGRDRFTGDNLPDDYWKIGILGDALKTQQMNPAVLGSRAKVGIWLNSRRVEPKQAGQEVLYFINATLAEIELL